MDGLTTIITYIKRGDFADLPDAAALDALIHPSTAAFFYAEDTTTLYFLNRTTVGWDIIAAGGGGVSAFASLTDVSLTAIAPDDLFKWDGSNVVNITPSDMLVLIGAGDVAGPGSSIAGNLPSFADTTGKVLDDSGIAASDVLVSGDIGSAVAAAPSGGANTPLFDDGAGGFANGTRSGGTTEVATVTGAKTSGNLLKWDASGNAVDSGVAAAGIGSGDVVGPASAADGNLALFDGITGKLLQDGGSLIAPAAGLTIVFGVGGFTFTLANDLLALEGLGSTGIAARIGANTWAQRTIIAPAAGITISNGDGVSGNPTLALANDLAALEGMAGSGLVARTASETYAQRTITAPAAGITVSDGDGVSGNPTLVLANDLSALEAMAGTGLVARTASETYAQRTVTAPAAGITVSNGDGVAGNPTLALANDLSALEALSSTGLAVRTAADTWAQRTITGPAAGLSVSNGDGVSGNPTLALANDLAALEGMAGTGLVARTASETYAQRTLTAPAAGITVSNGDGVSGNPTLALANDLSALEAMAGTGIVARTASEAYAQRTITAGPGISVSNGSGVSGNPTITKQDVIIIAVSDETTAITTGTAKVTFRMPYAFTLSSVRASLTAASTSGIPEFNVKESGTTIFSTNLTIDANEKTSTTAATAAVISDTALADDAEMTIDIVTAGTGAKGAKLYFIGTCA